MASKEIFANPYKGTPKVWAPQVASVTFTSSKTKFIAALTQVQITYSRTVSDMYPIGINDGPIRQLGIPNGTATFNNIIAPEQDLTNFLSTFGNTCKPFGMQIKFDTKSAGIVCPGTLSGSMSLNITDAIGQQFTFTLSSAQGGLAQATGAFVIQFNTLTYSK